MDKKTITLSQIKDKKIKSLINAAYSAQKNAYAPYSEYKIGAGILDSTNALFAGCNIENSSYGGTVCAERVAIWKGVSEKMKLPIKVIAVVSSVAEKWPPCGLCRQVMAEFCTPETLVYFGNNKKEFRLMKFSDLFPEAFSHSFILPK